MLGINSLRILFGALPESGDEDNGSNHGEITIPLENAGDLGDDVGIDEVYGEPEDPHDSPVESLSTDAFGENDEMLTALDGMDGKAVGTQAEADVSPVVMTPEEGSSDDSSSSSRLSTFPTPLSVPIWVQATGHEAQFRRGSTPANDTDANQGQTSDASPMSNPADDTQAAERSVPDIVKQLRAEVKQEWEAKYPNGPNPYDESDTWDEETMGLYADALNQPPKRKD